MKKRMLSLFLAVMMLVSVVPTTVFADNSGTPAVQALSDIMENTNQASGVVLRKGVSLHKVNGVPDGTADVMIEAYTTSKVTQTTASTPTDIVLVLDVSGSMDDNPTTTTTTTYEAVNATYFRRWVYYRYVYYYGFNTTYTTYYVNIGTAETPHYVEVEYEGADSNNFYYYHYYDANDQQTFVYPALDTTPSASREHDYPVVRFYVQETHENTTYAIDSLKTAVDAFIEATHQKNAELTAQGKTELHRISIVKFASNSYKGGTASLDEGDDMFQSGRNSYNYTQVVKNLTVVDAAGEAALSNAVNALTVGGATAVDYGLNLASMVLAQPLPTATQRNKVVIVFSDGSPTHGSNFDTSVANDAIATAKSIKTGAKVYSISVAANADTSDTSSNDNKFFHYVSSNYPNAESMSNAGTGGSTGGGYYLTPTSSSSLAMIFQGIAQNIENTAIELGETAEIVDTMSTYFTVPDGTDSVTLQTADRIKDAAGNWAWADPVDATGVTAIVQHKTVVVNGFDYDDNYLSNTARTKGTNTEYYGTKLIITINVSPDYNALDTHASSITGGYLPSNDGTANLLNSKAEAVATVDTPYLPTNTVTYQYVDPTSSGTVTYKQYYRLPGSALSKISDTPAVAGYTFSGWSTADTTVAADGKYTMPEGDVVFTGAFTPNKHNVTYTITGHNPGAAEPADQTGIDYGTEVTVADDLTYPGYTFTGWFTYDSFVTADTAKFTMPDNDVNLIGYFSANSGIPFKTIHYTENLDGTYSPVETVNDTGFTDQEVTAAVRTYEGFTLTDVSDVTVADGSGTATLSTVSSGKITADGEFTMHQFHKRNAYDVTYRYEGTVPAGATELAAYTETDVPFDTVVTVKPDATAPGYTFSGWRIESPTDSVINGGTTFTMPASDVVLVGSFTANTDTEYTVEYYWQNVTGSDYTLHESVPHHDGVTDQNVSAPQKTYTGLTLNLNAAGTVASGTVKADGSLVLKLYYDRNTYDVTYTYEGTVPSDATDLTAYAQTGVRFGATVNVQPDATAQGYIFSGWRIDSPSTTVINGGTTFTMPADDVVLIGEFAAGTSTKYTVEYYWQNITDNDYTLYESETHYNGVTGQNVDAPKNTYLGLTLNLNAPGTVASGTVAADGSLVLKLYYDRNTYDVTYRYEGTEPADATDLTTYAQTDVRFGATVDVKPDATAQGYTFSGWDMESPSGVDFAGGSFTMPADDVVFVGSFTARTDTEYKVEYYWQNLNGNGYTLYETDTYKNGVTGETVNALLKSYTGLTLNLNAAGTLASGTVKADGSLVLKLYYDRVLYNVTYEYDGTVPADATQLPVASTAYYTTKVSVAPNATAQGYTFSGWRIKSPAGITLHTDGTGTSFTMPASDVVLSGTFVLDPTYYIEYYLEQPDGSYKKDEAASHSHTAPIGSTVSAHIRAFDGYTENTTHAERKPSGTVEADVALVLKLYYDLIEYTVTYEYEGTIPASAPTLPAPAKQYYKDIVTAFNPETEGYTFSGWTSAQVGNVAPDATFNMPMTNVVLKGKFIADEAIYKIEHYLMNDSGTYDGVTPHIETKSGIVDDAVRATTYQPYLDLGAVIDTAKTYADGKWEGIVLPSAANPLVLKLYYSREPAARVTYHYEGDLTADEWRALGWPDLPSDTTKYYVGATVTAKNFATAMASNWVFEGWYASDPTISVKPDGTFRMPRLAGTDPVIKLYGRWIDTTPKEFTVKYFVDDVELPQYTATYPADTPVSVMAKLADTAERTYTDWSAPESVTAGVDIVNNADGTFTMSETGEIHIKCTSTLLPPKTYTVTYYLNAAQYRQFTYAAGETHTIIDGPLVMAGEEFSGWSAPRTTSGAQIALTQSSGRYVFTMPEADVVIYGSLIKLPDPDCELVIHKVVSAPSDFTGTMTYTFNLYRLDGTNKQLVHTEHITVDRATGKGSSSVIQIEANVRYIIEEVGAAIPGYSLETVLKNSAGTVLPLNEAIQFKGLYTGPNEVTFTNTYEELALDTHNHFGYIIGYPDDTVRPNDDLSRAEAVTIFFRLLTDAKREEFWSQTNPFEDVAPDAWYNNAISTLYNAGVLTGYENNTFRPDEPITRAELVKIAMSFYGTPNASNEDLFADTGKHWAESFINAAAEIGFIDGNGDGTFDPDRYVTRAEAMKIINRTLVRKPHKDHLLSTMITWSDNADTSAWYYAEVQEATNSHTYMYTSAHEIWEALLPVRDWEALEKTWSDANSGKE